MSNDPQRSDSGKTMNTGVLISVSWDVDRLISLIA